MTKKNAPPSIKATAFECPHCGAFTTQYWYKLSAKRMEDNSPLPFVPNEEYKKRVVEDKDCSPEIKKRCLDWFKQMDTGLVFLEKLNQSQYCNYDANNLFLSECYHCKKLTVWVHDIIVFPHEKIGIIPNQDLPDDIIRDFEEARDIVNLSARGAAALLRLCVQKLCIFLGEKGKSIDDDIAKLVLKGLNPLVQKSLDIVRVIGNEAVHPGVIDLNDNKDTANRLFNLINSIADQMITHPKNIEEMYKNLPEAKRKAIEARDNKTKP